MTHCKLQIGCFLVTVYIILMYLKYRDRKRSPTKKLFKILCCLIPCSIFFDGLTAYTVNNLETIPDYVNLLAHLLFYIFIDFEIFFVFLYMLDITRGFPRKNFWKVLYLLPLCVSMFFIFFYIKDIEYVIGKTTNYSWGKSSMACFASCTIYFLIAYIIMMLGFKRLEKRKIVGISTIIRISFIILILQLIFPEILMTSLASMMFIVGTYINIEDPSLRLLKKRNDDVVMGFSTLVENRDNNTGGHIIRTKDYVEILLNRMKEEMLYKNLVTKDFEQHMLSAAPMHDIGKISTPDHILQKPGKLTDEEFKIMRYHAPNGGEILIDTFGNLNDPEFMKIAYNVARFHHEKWNGKGYPEGLSGEEIPICARIMAIADVFDAVSAKRCYRDALPLDVCFKIIEDGIGQDFDPILAKLFLELKEEITEYYKKSNVS